MPDPLFLLRAISAVTGLVDVSSRVFSGAIKFYKPGPGASEEQIEIESTASQMKETESKLDDTLNSDT